MRRSTFYDQQARYRRATWRWTLLAGAAVIGMGLPLSLVLTPLVYLLVLVALHALDRVATVPAVVWSAVDRMATLIPTAVEAYDAGPRQLLGGAGPLALCLVVPGAVAILVMWMGVRRLVDRAGLEATLRALGARPPQIEVFEEQQFRHIVEEMAIAAGIEAPGVWIGEQLSPNMALAGSTVDRAAIVASRRLLNTCDRAETQALVAHLMASLVNGDPAIAARIESVYLTNAALNALVNAPFGRTGRRGVKALLGALVRRPDSAAATRALEALLQEWGTPSNDLTRFLERDPTRPPSVWRQVLRLLLIPLYLLNIAVMITASLLEAGVVGPLLGRVWRTRRFLADRSCVELTRSPTQLTRALHNIGGALGDPHWAPARLRTVIAGDVSNPVRTPGGLTNAHPSVEKRMRCLIEQGAVVTWEPRAPLRPASGVLRAAGAVILFPLLTLMAYLTAMLVAVVTVLAVGAMAVTLAAIHSMFRLLQ